jgi:hypothetical protein
MAEKGGKFKDGKFKVASSKLKVKDMLPLDFEL